MCYKTCNTYKKKFHNTDVTHIVQLCIILMSQNLVSGLSKIILVYPNLHVNNSTFSRRYIALLS